MNCTSRKRKGRGRRKEIDKDRVTFSGFQIRWWLCMTTRERRKAGNERSCDRAVRDNQSKTKNGFKKKKVRKEWSEINEKGVFFLCYHQSPSIHPHPGMCFQPLDFLFLSRFFISYCFQISSFTACLNAINSSSRRRSTIPRDSCSIVLAEFLSIDPSVTNSTCSCFHILLFLHYLIFRSGTFTGCLSRLFSTSSCSFLIILFETSSSTCPSFFLDPSLPEATPPALRPPAPPFASPFLVTENLDLLLLPCFLPLLCECVLTVTLLHCLSVSSLTLSFFLVDARNKLLVMTSSTRTESSNQRCGWSWWERSSQQSADKRISANSNSFSLWSTRWSWAFLPNCQQCGDCQRILSIDDAPNQAESRPICCNSVKVSCGNGRPIAIVEYVQIEHLTQSESLDMCNQRGSIAEQAEINHHKPQQNIQMRSHQINEPK